MAKWKICVDAGVGGGALVVFFYHILEVPYDKKIQNVYHIEFYHILSISKSLSYRSLSYYNQLPKLYHIRFIIFEI